MTNEQLQQLRKALFLDISEVAEFVGKVSTRTWQRWEKGDLNVPDDVACEMIKLINIQDEAVNLVLKEEIEYCYYYYDYNDFSDKFGKNKVKWRLYQSIIARLYQIFGDSLSLKKAPENCNLYQYISNKL
ncbi:DUF1870 family protein [Testudinibacter sp. TR-2022]|uniref:Aca2/YdiL-like domain-containing protein n=1 Tax=Testudinibacter sp. TR-2022 TaxID=2585029 RepID=UPI001117E623|nr:DUF1870 family protein [Testudinibacter sp. TR-2022]TNH03662.1 DUF1870 family protein [Testudinibacter sp. TR-2022]TNH04949.1 DUF1870 family protein [Pasteurellaceae bacterium Phil31]TNH06721.1 DUF1870 family protein [Testudinibacter sp. TR-2022]